MSETDYIAELGALALASRLRRLLHWMHSDGDQVYRSLRVDFKPKWFPVLHLLSERSHLTLTEVSRMLSVAHPSSIETVDELVSAGLVESVRSKVDARRRELSLTGKGKRLCRELSHVWDAFRIAGEEVAEERGNDFLEALSKLEQSLAERSLYDRIMAELDRKRLRKQER